MWGKIHPSAKYGTKIQNLGLLLRVGDKQSKWETNNKRRKIMSKNGINIKRIGLTSKVGDQLPNWGRHKKCDIQSGGLTKIQSL